MVLQDLNRRKRAEARARRAKNYSTGQAAAEMPSNWHLNLKNVGRCPECGGKVELPCRECAVRAAKQSRAPRERERERERERANPQPFCQENPMETTAPRFTTNNGHASPIAPAPTAADTIKMLSTLTPAEVTAALDELESAFSRAKSEYVRRRKLLRLLCGGLGKPAAARKSGRRVEPPDWAAIISLAAVEGEIDRDQVAEKFGLKRNGATAKLKAIAARGHLQETSDGRYRPAG